MDFADSLKGVAKFLQEASRPFCAIACDPVGDRVEIVFNVARKPDFHD
jgi:hypothetical protein